MRQVKNVLLEAGVSLPAASQPTVFATILPPNEIPEKEAIDSEQGPQTTTDNVEAASVSTGEGHLQSEEADLNRQANASGLPEAADNLLNTDQGTTRET